MTRLKEHINVFRTPEEAFAYTADFSNIADWDPGVAESSSAEEGPVGEGSTFDLLVTFGSRRVPMQYRITEYEPSRRVVLVGEGDKIRAVDEITFAPTSDGTAITYVADLNFEGLMKWISPLLKPALRKVGRNAVEGLARTLDSQ